MTSDNQNQLGEQVSTYSYIMDSAPQIFAEGRRVYYFLAHDRYLTHIGWELHADADMHMKIHMKKFIILGSNIQIKF